MTTDSTKKTEHTQPAKPIVVRSPEELIQFWGRSKRSRAVATCYTELWQDRHKEEARAIVEFARANPDVTPQHVLKAFPDIYPAVIVTLVQGPIYLHSEPKEAGNDGDANTCAAKGARSDAGTDTEASIDTDVDADAENGPDPVDGLPE